MKPWHDCSLIMHGGGDGAGRLDPARIALLMFDCQSPRSAGSLAGEYFAATIENDPRYPSLRDQRAILARIDQFVVRHFDEVVEAILPGLGFNAVDAAQYRIAALCAFRAAIPIH